MNDTKICMRQFSCDWIIDAKDNRTWKNIVAEVHTSSADIFLTGIRNFDSFRCDSDNKIGWVLNDDRNRSVDAFWYCGSSSRAG